MSKVIKLIYRYLGVFPLIVLFCLPFEIYAQNDTLCARGNSGDGNIYVGTLNILTLPEDEASVYIDDVLVGYTPFLKKIAVGEHKLCVKKEHYYDYNEVITISDSKMVKKIRLDLMYGYIQVSSTPVGAHLYVDDKETSLMTPCTTGKINPGQVKVSLKIADYQTFDTVVTIDESSVSRFHVDMQKSDVYNNITKDEYYSQLYADTIRLSMLLAKDYIAAQVEDANKSHEKKQNVGKSSTDDKVVSETKSKPVKSKTDDKVVSETKPKPVRTKETNKKGSAVWLKAGSGLSGVWKTANKTATEKYELVCPTFYAGVQYSYRFNRFFGLGVDLSYSRTGYKNSYFVKEHQYKDKFMFNSIDIPVMAKLYILKNDIGPVIEIGPTVDYKINYTMTRDLLNGEQDVEKLSYKAINFGAAAGIGYDFKISKAVFTVNFRTIMELSSVFENVNYNLFYMQFGIGVKIY